LAEPIVDSDHTQIIWCSPRNARVDDPLNKLNKLSVVTISYVDAHDFFAERRSPHIRYRGRGFDSGLGL
jgi:hypothetical protein